MKVINGKESGSGLDQLHNISPRTLVSLTDKDAFLHNETGDILVYNKSDSRWIPIGNVSMHDKKSAEKFGSK